MNSRAKKILLLHSRPCCSRSTVSSARPQSRAGATLGITRIEPLEKRRPCWPYDPGARRFSRAHCQCALDSHQSSCRRKASISRWSSSPIGSPRLEPHIVTVWQVQAWNMAFNVSVKFSDYRDRWRWVQRGMELLRDEAFRYNPEQPHLYADLAWMFQFKMGQTSTTGTSITRGRGRPR